jgi:hypothetical protein
MCIPNQKLDKKTRCLMALANISLVLGLSLWLCVHPTAQIEKNWLHAICGFLLGFNVTVNLCRLRVARRCREKQI